MGLRRPGSVEKVTRAVMKVVLAKRLGFIYNWASQRGKKLGMSDQEYLTRALRGDVQCSMYMLSVRLVKCRSLHAEVVMGIALT